MNKTFKVVIVGLVLGGVSFLAAKLFGPGWAADRFLMISMSIYIVLGLILSWRLVYDKQPDPEAEEGENSTSKKVSKAFPKRKPLTPFGYSFFIAVAMMLLLDLVIR